MTVAARAPAVWGAVLTIIGSDAGPFSDPDGFAWETTTVRAA